MKDIWREKKRKRMNKEGKRDREKESEFYQRICVYRVFIFFIRLVFAYNRWTIMLKNISKFPVKE